MNILITGGSSGLGYAAVRKLCQAKDNIVFLTYAHSEEKAKLIESEFDNARSIHCDFTSKESVNAFIQKLPVMNIDILINNAITNINKEHFHKIDPDTITEGFQSNLLPTIRITQECIKTFRKKKFGKIINIISSYVTGFPPVGLSEYVATKSFLLSLSNSWATENIRFNITSNAVSPGFMLTELTRDTDERIIEAMTNEHPLRKLLAPDEVADYLMFLSTCSQQINGTNLVIGAG